MVLLPSKQHLVYNNKKMRNKTFLHHLEMEICCCGAASLNISRSRPLFIFIFNFFFSNVAAPLNRNLPLRYLFLPILLLILFFYSFSSKFHSAKFGDYWSLFLLILLSVISLNFSLSITLTPWLSRLWCSIGTTPFY